MCIVLENKGQFIEGKSAARSQSSSSRSAVQQALILYYAPKEQAFQQEARNHPVSGFFLYVLTKICRQ